MNPNFGTAKLIEDLGNLLDGGQGTDIQLKIGGGDTATIPSATTGETIFNSAEVITMHAHSAILRCRSTYFANIFNNEEEWKEQLKGSSAYTKHFPDRLQIGPPLHLHRHNSEHRDGAPHRPDSCGGKDRTQRVEHRVSNASVRCVGSDLKQERLAKYR